MGILPLRIETGRFQNLDLKDRLCMYCNSGHIEDENHFIFHCNHYDHLRGPFLEKCSLAIDNFIKEAFLFRKNTKLLKIEKCF